MPGVAGCDLQRLKTASCEGFGHVEREVLLDEGLGAFQLVGDTAAVLLSRDSYPPSPQLGRDATAALPPSPRRGWPCPCRAGSEHID